MVNQDIMTPNAVSARRWYASGSPGLPATGQEDAAGDFNVSVWVGFETGAGGSLGALTPFAPAFTSSIT